MPKVDTLLITNYRYGRYAISDTDDRPIRADTLIRTDKRLIRSDTLQIRICTQNDTDLYAE